MKHELTDKCIIKNNVCDTCIHKSKNENWNEEPCKTCIGEYKACCYESSK